METKDPRDEEATSQTLAGRSLTVATLTGSSRVLGLLRDVVFSSFFGAGHVADAFFVAFRIPNFFRRLLAEGAFAQAFVPVLSDIQEKQAREEVELFVRTVAGNFGVVLVAICVVGVLLAPVLVITFTLGAWQDDPRQALASDLLRIMFPYLGLISFTAFAGAILNSFNRFSVPAFTPILLNVALIAGALAGARTLDNPVYSLAWAVIIAGVLQFAVHMPSLATLKLLRLPRIDWKAEGTKRLLRLLGPAVYAASAGQINILIGTILAAQLVVGSVSWLYYADRLIELPVGMIAIAIQTVVLPRLSRLHSKGADSEFRSSLAWGVHIGILLGLPATVGLCMIATPLVSTLFFHGAFTTDDVRMTAIALQAFAVGLLPLMLVKIAAPGFYGRQDTATPFKYATIGIAVNIVVSLCLFRLIGHIGIALATSIAAIVHSLLLLWGLARRSDMELNRELVVVCLQATAGCIAMACVVYLLSPDVDYWLTTGVMQRIGWLSLLMSAALASYFVVLLAVGVRPLKLWRQV